IENMLTGDDSGETFYEMLGTDEEKKDIEIKRNFYTFFNTFKGKLDFFKRKTNDNIRAIDSLMKAEQSIILEETDAIRLEALEMGLKKDPPFKGKNSTADAIIFLQFIDYVKRNNIANSYFISWNKSDFCINNSSKLNDNLNEMLTLANAKFYTALAYAVNHIKADILTLQDLRQLNLRQQQLFYDDDANDDYSCKCCQLSKNVVSPIYFHEGTEVQDERFIKDYNQLSLFEEENIFEDGYLIPPKKREYLLEADCGYCGAEHIKCPECGHVMDFSDDKEYNTVQYCDGCNLKFIYKQSIGRKGDIEDLEFIILNELIKCAHCGEEYEDDGSGTSICPKCEEIYSYDD
ncbi:MAG: hypothetical protein L6Q66_06615, partial [Bacteroidia bacterium]|nr:hypothetical protein [Bacteroidia bacterium]